MINIIGLFFVFIFFGNTKNKQRDVQKVFPLTNSDEELGYYKDEELDYFKDEDYISLIPLHYPLMKKNEYIQEKINFKIKID